MSANDRFDALVIFEESGKRGQLKQAALALTAFRRVSTAATLAEGLSKLNGIEDVDVVFLSFEFGWERLTDFLTKAKETPLGQDSAYVVVMKPDDETGETKARSAFAGVHACLYEPYSADNLLVIAQVAARIKEAAADRREQAAVQMLVMEIIKHTDALAYFKKHKKNTGPVLRKLKHACDSVKKLGERGEKLYIELALSMFEQAKPLDAQMYTGASERVKRLMESRLAQRMENEYTEN